MLIESLVAAVITLVLSYLYSLITKDEESTFLTHFKNAVISMISVIIISLVFKNKKVSGYLNQPMKTGTPGF